jgi:hypothetical protein
MFFREILFVYATLAVLSLLGGFVVLPFRSRLKYGLLAAPFAGLLTVVIGVACFYSVTGRSLAQCALASAAICAVATIAALLISPVNLRRQDWAGLAFATLLVIPITTFATEASAVRLHTPALLYTDGTDHIGYAHMADWLSNHTVSQSPGSSARIPYEQFPNWLLRADPRFGSFFCLAILKTFRGLPAVFTFDFACAVVLSAGLLGVAGAFARSRLSLVVVLIGLLTSHWYDYSRSGFFGKILAYPGSLLVAGLFLSVWDTRTSLQLAALTILTAATALMHSGMATALFLCATVGGALLCRFAFERSWQNRDRLVEIASQAGALVLLVVVAVVSTGVLARPLTVTYPDVHPDWRFILPRILDLLNQRPSDQYFGPAQLRWATPLALGIWFAIGVLAWRTRNWASTGLVVGPMLLMVAMRLFGTPAAAIQLIGTFYPFSICALALLLNGNESSSSASDPLPGRRYVPVLAMVLAVVCIGLRVPRYAESFRRYAITQEVLCDRYSMREIDRLIARIGRERVEVAPMGGNQALFVLVEFSRRDVNLQWSPEMWQAVVGSTAGWTVPEYGSPAPFRLVAPDAETGDCRVISRTAQYKLLDCTGRR